MFCDLVPAEVPNARVAPHSFVLSASRGETEGRIARRRVVGPEGWKKPERIAPTAVKNPRNLIAQGFAGDSNLLLSDQISFKRCQIHIRRTASLSGLPWDIAAVIVNGQLIPPRMRGRYPKSHPVHVERALRPPAAPLSFPVPDRAVRRSGRLQVPFPPASGRGYRESAPVHMPPPGVRAARCVYPPESH